MPLRILKASAGSGKTYSLTEAYIRFCLDENDHLDYSNILAITFTNKASAEMKDRIMGLLYTLSQEPMAYSGIANLMADLEMTTDEIRIKSQFILNRILQNFDLFTITTIDSFFTRLYGSMTLDLFGDPPREVSLDIDRALEHASGKLIEAARMDVELRRVVIDILDEKIREGEGLRLKQSLMKLGHQLFNDEYLRLQDGDQYVHPANEIHRGLTQTVELVDIHFQEFKDRLNELLARAGMSHSDFSNKFTGNLVRKDNILELYKLKTFSKITRSEEWFAKAKKDAMMTKVAPIMDDLLRLGEEFYDYVRNHYRTYATYSVVLDNYGPYRVLRFLYQAVQQYLQDQRLIFLSDINLKIHRNLTAEDSMIVYEKLGQRLRAIMIDEFQDTSQIQWDNLMPLIQNNMAEGYPNLVVGDVKQAIYRFRNGNWEIMEIQVPEFKKRWDEDGLIEDLQYNWRSSPEIVAFNNELFSGLSESLSRALSLFLSGEFTATTSPDSGKPGYDEMQLLADAPRRIYGNTSQRVADKNKDQTGYVELNYEVFEKGSEKEVIEETRMAWFKDVLADLFKDGFYGADIGVLARGRKELALLSEYLTRWSEEDIRFRFSSDNSLKLDLSDGVQVLVAALKVKAGVDVDINRMVFYNYLIKLDQPATNDAAWTAALPGLENPIQEVLGSSLFLHSGLEQLSLFFESVIELTGIADRSGQWPYILSFIEEVKKFELQNGPDVPQFLEEWDNRIRHIQIQMSDDREKIRLFTIHKSKGLEFDVVILPFGEWDFENAGQQNILWVEDRHDDLLKYAGPLPVTYKVDLIHTSFDYALMTEYLHNVMDNLNLLYVALTRPRQRLYIWMYEKEMSGNSRSNGFDKPVTNTRDFFRMAFDSLAGGTVSRGSKIPKLLGTDAIASDNREILRTYPLSHHPPSLQLKPSFDGSANESIGRGLIIHGLLENIKYYGDIPTAISKSILTGDITEKSRNEWTDIMQSIVDYEPVRHFFDDDWKVYNEKSIMVPGGAEYRPDRIQENGVEYVVIDYKTGAKHESHQRQIRNYKSIIAGMVDLPVRCFLYYPEIPDLLEVK